MLRNFLGGPLTADTFLQLVGFLFAVMFALILHELAHGMVAKWNGDLTAKNAGRLTLNPLKHLDPIGTLLMLFVGFGWAKPVPVNPNYFKKQRKGIFTVAIAGVTVNFILIIVCFCMLLLTQYLGTLTGGAFEAEGISHIFYYMFFYFFLFGISANATFMAFNLLPIYPLDGFRVVEAFTHHTNKYCVFMRRYGQQIILGLLLLGMFADILTRFWVGFAYFDVLGQYIGAVQGGINSLLALIFGVA